MDSRNRDTTYDGFLLYDDLGVDIWRCWLDSIIGSWMMGYSITMDTNAHLFLCSIQLACASM